MVSNLKKLAEDFQKLKTKVVKLEEEMQFLKANYRALGYLPEDSFGSAEEVAELERIDRLVKAGDREELEELETICAFDAAQKSQDEAIPFEDAVKEIEQDR